MRPGRSPKTRCCWTFARHKSCCAASWSATTTKILTVWTFRQFSSGVRRFGWVKGNGWGLVGTPGEEICPLTVASVPSERGLSPHWKKGTSPIRINQGFCLDPGFPLSLAIRPWALRVFDAVDEREPRQHVHKRPSHFWVPRAFLLVGGFALSGGLPFCSFEAPGLRQYVFPVRLGFVLKTRECASVKHLEVRTL